MQDIAHTSCRRLLEHLAQPGVLRMLVTSAKGASKPKRPRKEAEHERQQAEAAAAR